MSYTNIISAVLLSLDEREYNKQCQNGTCTRYVKTYERRRSFKRNYSPDDRYPEIQSQFMRR